MKSITLEFNPYDFDALEAYFEQMAQKGYLLQALDDSYAIFAREKSAVFLYRIDCCDSGNVDEMVQKYIEFGWEYVLTGTNNRVLFRSPESEKPPRFDCANRDTTQTQASKTQAKENYILSSAILLVVTVGMIAAIIYFRDSPIEYILGFSCYYLFFLVSWLAHRLTHHSYLCKSKKRNSVALWLAIIFSAIFTVVGTILIVGSTQS